MIIKSAKFQGLIGIYRGTGLKYIEIDFSKCIHNIVLICGPNGSGKSTLMAALNPFPDNHQMYLSKEPGYKELEYITDDGILYKLRIEYPINKDGDRLTTKAFIQKTSCGNMIELNENGNIGSYKSCILQEFGLDPNFISLSRLSTEDRGIVEKTPSERKKYVSNILESTTVYNDMYKVLNKRASIFKSMVNSIVTRIDNIGDYEYLKSSLESTKNRLKSLSDKKEILIKQLADAEAAIKLLDSTGDIRKEYETLVNLKGSIKDELRSIETAMSVYSNKGYGVYCENPENTQNEILRINKEIKQLESGIITLKERVGMLLINSEEESKRLIVKQTKLNSLQSEYNYDDLIQELDNLKKQLEEYDEIIKKYNIPENITITKEEFLVGLNTLSNVQDNINTIRSYAYEKNIETAIECVKNGTNVSNIIQNIEDRKRELEEEINSIKEQIVGYEMLIESMNVLSNRPTTCNDDGCPFIKNALEAQSKDPVNKLNTLGDRKSLLENELKSIQEELNDYQQVITIINDFHLAIRAIDTNKSILFKFPNGDIFKNQYYVLEAIKNSDGLFKSIENFRACVDYINVVELKRNILIRFKELETEKKLYDNKNEMIEELCDEMKSLSEKVSSLSIEIEKTNGSINSKQRRLEELKTNLEILELVRDKVIRREELKRSENDTTTKLVMIETTISNIESAVQNANMINTELLTVNHDIEPLTAELSKLEYAMKNREEYVKELEVYTDKYNMVEMLKRYTSPTKEGIQNLFINLYMGQTLSMTNKLLKRMFNGELELMDYIINDKEFRIPCASTESSIINDDISSCSFAQKCMISMILSFVLLVQSSTIYNIPQIDELDGGLDKVNKPNFIPLIQEIMSIFNMRQCLMISHSTESVFSDVDIIMLGNEINEAPSGNVIFSV